MNNYVKIVYQSEPIGKERIILYLTTFDKEAFDRDQQIKEKIETISVEFDKADLNSPDFIVNFGKNLNTMVKGYYKQLIEELKQNKNVKNISNADDVHCGVVYGNITNCDNIYCTEIKGNIVNCDKIIYK